MSLDLPSYSLSTESLCAAFKRGLLPGPEETAEDFVQRIHRASSSYAAEWKEANAVLQPLVGFTIDWVPIHQAKRLFFWESGATWISEEGAAVIELKSWGYKQTEVLSHEALHVLRCQFNEPRFEEHLAYATSSKKWRRTLGPLFRSSKESIVFLLSLLIGLYEPLWSLPILIFFASRLWFERRIFQQCLRKWGLQITACLTDQEIALFSNMSKEEMRAYICKQTCLRWKYIKTIF